MRIVYSYQGKEEYTYNMEKTDVIIGRSDKQKGVEVDLDLEKIDKQRKVSRPHARIWLENGKYWIKDLGSKHGTFVDGVEIKGKGKMVLKPGVLVQIGDTMLKLMEEKGAGEQRRKGEGEKSSELSLQVRVEVKCLPTVNYSLVHADLPFLLEVTLFNNGDAPLKDVKLQTLLPEYAESEIVNITSIPAKGSYKVNPLPKFQFHRDRLRDLPEPETVPLEVWVNGKRVPLNPTIEVSILPPNAWDCVGQDSALAGFVMPKSDAVDEIVSRARFELRRLLKVAQGFADAIESSDPKAVEKTLKALYFCLQERYGITYEYDPRSYAPDWQMVRFHHEVLEEKEGTCIDLALLFAACLENVQLDPLIIIVKTGANIQHAVIGCWRKESPRLGAVIYDEKQIRQLVNSGEILVLDSKGFPQTREFPAGMPFSRCQKKGIRYVEDFPLVYALDIVAARDAGISPMPFGKGMQYDRSAWLAIFRARREAEKLQSPNVCARHLLLGLISLGNGLMRQVFAQLEKDTDEIAKFTRVSIPRTNSPRRPVPEDANWQAVIKCAEKITACRSESLITETDLLTALLETPTQIDKVLEHFGLTRQKCLDKLREIIKGGSILSEWHSSGFMS